MTQTAVETSPPPGSLHYSCNICSAPNTALAASLERESGACSSCGANVRFRSVAAVLTKHLFGDVVALGDIAANQAICGVGMSDASCYADRLAAKFNYTNTYFHCQPHLDVTAPEAHWMGKQDFVIASDVFEHLEPPIQRAFDKMYALLKPNGIAVFSVPYTFEAESREHFPNLHSFTIQQESADAWVLNNVARDGEVEQFRDLVFHGGPGSTLEMRLFSLAALNRHFTAAGFIDVRVHSEPYFEHGIFWLHPWSVTISAKRGAVPANSATL